MLDKYTLTRNWHIANIKIQPGNKCKTDNLSVIRQYYSECTMALLDNHPLPSTSFCCKLKTELYDKAYY